MTSRAQKLLNEAKRLLDAADEKQRSIDADRWAAAERMWQASREEGVSMRAIALAVGFRNQSSVSRHIEIWDRYGSVADSNRPAYAEAYYEVQGMSRDERYDLAARQTLREADEATIGKLVSSLPPDRQAVVVRAALRRRDVADEVMEDREIRMRARAAAERQAGAAHAQAESERKAHASALREDTQDAVDGRALTELGGALGRIIGTTRAAAEIWKRWEPKVSEEARAAAIDDIGNTQARSDTILGAMRGADLDAALDRILAESEEST